MGENPNPRETPVTVRRILDEILLMGANIVPALIYLLIYGLLLSGTGMNTLLFGLFAVAVLIDIGSEYWVADLSFKYDHPLIDTVSRVHYAITGLAYLTALIGFFLAPEQLFLAYSVFLVLWLAGFLIGESLLMFVDDPYEERVELE